MGNSIQTTKGNQEKKTFQFIIKVWKIIKKCVRKNNKGSFHLFSETTPLIRLKKGGTLKDSEERNKDDGLNDQIKKGFQEKRKKHSRK